MIESAVDFAMDMQTSTLRGVGEGFGVAGAVGRLESLGLGSFEVLDVGDEDEVLFAPVALEGLRDEGILSCGFDGAMAAFWTLSDCRRGDALVGEGLTDCFLGEVSLCFVVWFSVDGVGSDGADVADGSVEV